MGYQKVSNINEETEIMGPDNNLSSGKLFLLGAFSLALSSFGPMSFFASVPLAMAALLYGRMKAFVMVAALSAILFSIVVKFSFTPYLGVVFLISYLYSALLSEVFLRNIHPIRGLLISGAVVMLTLLALLGLTVASGVDIVAELKAAVTQTMDVIRENNAELLAQKGEEARLLEDLLSNPDDVVKKIIFWSPAAIFVSNYFILWACLFVLLKNSLIWKLKHSYSYSVMEMVRFKVPEILVWPFIFSLGLAVGGAYFLGEPAEVIGENLLYCFGVFYFFQGFGIYLDFLSFARIQGIFRSLLVIFTVSMAWKLIAVVGVFDFWINFRRFFKSNEDKNNN